MELKQHWIAKQGFHILSLLFSCLFVVTLYLHTQLLYRQVFFIILLFLFAMPFLKADNRFLNWLTIFYTAGNLLYLYALKIMELFELSSPDTILINRLLVPLQIVPLYIVCSVFIKKFQMTIKPLNMDRRIFLLLISMLAIFFLWLVAISERWFYIIMFSFIQAALQEILWRGMLQQAFVRFLPPMLTFFLIAIASGISQLSIGFSYPMCIFTGVASIVMSVIYHRNGYLLYNIVIQWLVYTLLLSGSFIYVGL